MDEFRLRSELLLDSDGPSGPEFAGDLEIRVNPKYYSPENAAELVRVRDHFIDHPEGVLVDAYQAVTELELKHPTGTYEGQRRYLIGLRGEIRELQAELQHARIENPYLKIGPHSQVADDHWLFALLDPDRLRHTDIAPDRKVKCLSEAGDSLWYVARFAHESGTTLSRAFVEFLRHSQQGQPLQDREERGMGDIVRDQASRILSFEWIQKVALDNKMAFYFEGNGYPHKITIDSHPDLILDRILEELSRVEVDIRLESNAEQLWDWSHPYPHLPTKELTIGKLVWFLAYTSSTLLNTDFSTLMRYNLEKLRNRGEHGTIFSKHLRDDREEATARTRGSRRAPIE